MIFVGDIAGTIDGVCLYGIILGAEPRGNENGFILDVESHGASICVYVYHGK